MKIYFFEQVNNFSVHLTRLKCNHIAPIEKKELPEKITSLSVPSDNKDIDFSFFWGYDIFPKNIIRHFTQWAFENREMKIGDIILQEVYLPPFPPLSIKLIAGVAITKVCNTENVKSFTYQTLQGHPEIGEATFTIEKMATEIVCTIRTYSKPNTAFPKKIQQVVTLPYQEYCTNMALKNMKKKIKSNE